MCMGARGHQSPTWTLAGHSLLTRRPLVCRWSAAKLRWCVISERRYATRAVPAPRTRERERELAYQRSDGEIWRDEKGKAVQLGELLKSLLKSAASRHQLPAAEKLISSFSTLKAAPNGEEMAHIATSKGLPNIPVTYDQQVAVPLDLDGSNTLLLQLSQSIFQTLPRLPTLCCNA